jgi:hypothetical protein
MAHDRGHTGHSPADAARWLDDKLFPIFGPPPLGPYDAESPRTPEHNLCPLCGHPMPEHTIEHEGAHSFLNCPEPASSDESTSATV